MPPELTLRAPTLDDVPAVAALLNRAAEADGAGWVNEDAIRNWFTNPNIPIAEDAVVAERDGRLVGYGDVYRAGEHEEKVWGDLRVAPEERATDTIARVVDWMEERAGRARFRLYAPERATEIREELERRGYVPVRYSFEMEIALEEEPAEPEWPDGITVRTFRDGDEERIHSVEQEAFADHWDFTSQSFDEWRHWHMQDGFDPACWFVAEDGEDIAGICLCRPEREGRPDVGWVASLAVRRPWRRRGLGRALLLHSFGELRSRGRRKAGLGVDGQNLTGAVRLYEQAGMHVARRSDTYERPAA